MHFQKIGNRGQSTSDLPVVPKKTFGRFVRSSITQAGFTLAEMLVVVAIFTILTAIIVFNYGDFTDNILATNMAYEVALTARQAQVFGLGVRSSEGAFSSAYGIFVNLSDGSHEEGTKNVIFFADSRPVDGNGRCNDINGTGHCTCTIVGSQADECVEQFALQRNIYIDSLQVKNGGSCESTTQLAVSFKRPNPDAVIVDQDNGGSGFELAQIRIVSPRNDQPRYVVIRNTGQISVERTALCP